MVVSRVESSYEKNLYEQVADRIQLLITEGTLQPGDRLPSVRKLRAQMSVSLSTVLEAYRLLEDRGLIQARPQSGYYVRDTLLVNPQEPEGIEPPSKTCDIDTSLVLQVSRAVQDPSVIQFGSATPNTTVLPLNTLNRIMGQVVRQQPLEAHAYDTSLGNEVLRHAIARRMIEAGCLTPPDQILTTNGTTEAVYLCLQAVTKPGDTVAIESPNYHGLIEVLGSLHLNALELPTHPREGVSLEHLETALKQRQIAAFAIVANFSNPLGSCMSDGKKQQLVELMERYSTPVIEDDIYGDLYFEGSRPKALKAFDREGLVMYCSSVNKTLSRALRVGWVAPGRFQSQVEKLKWIVNRTVSMVPQLTVATFLSTSGYDRHMRQMRRAYQSQKTRMIQAICEYFPPETRVTRPNGGQVLWVELPSQFDSYALYEEALERKISIAPGIMFSPSERYRHCFRLNFGIPWSTEADQAMQTLGHLIKQQLATQFLR